MTGLIPIDEMTTLKSASEVKAVADEAISIHEQQSVAALINQAANSGQHSVIWNRPMTDELKKVLEGQGYKITKNNHAADPNIGMKIWGF